MSSLVKAGAPAPFQQPALKRRHVAAATIGNALEFYDFLTYAYFAIQIGRAFFPSHSAYGSLMLSLATFGAGFVTRPLGAFVIGSFSDRVGRRPAMMLSFVLMGCSIIGLALIPPFAVIGWTAPVLAIIARMLQGFSLGGEVGTNSAFLCEAAAPGKRGLCVSWQLASQGIALTAGGLVGVCLSHLLSPAALGDYGWRIAFLIGAVTLPFGLWLRNGVPETIGLADSAGPQPVGGASRVGEARRHTRVLVLGLVVLAAGTINSYIFTYITTYAQSTLHMRAAAAFEAQTAGSFTIILAALVGGWLSDRIGRRPIYVWSNLVFLLLIYPVFAWIAATRSEPVLLLGVVLLNIAANFGQGAFFAALAESLPKPIRGSGFSVIYATSIAAFGGTTQLVVTWLIHLTGSALAPAFYLVAATAVGQVALMLMRESAPIRLPHILPETAVPDPA